MRGVLAWIALALMVGAPARAADDGGTQSVFAMGAGNRALSMGAAFVAAGNDASVLLWNPAGLGGLERSEFQAAQSGDLGAGFRESYASLAMPSWRWGTFGVSFRHFGVDGIESRDDRNVLLGSDLSDSEVEMMLGYGRSISPAWAVGGAVKLQRQSLAGLSGSGLGVDLGLKVHPGLALGVESPWADRVVWGIALRNVVEPSIRLDRESVADPMTLRTGVAYALPLRVADGFIAEVDLEKARGVGTKLRAGLEYRFMGLAALRMGMNGSRFAAGTGFQWRQLMLDYAFENGAVASSHRFGLTVPFGLTVAEGRLASQAAEDEALQEKLAEAFKARQREQVQALLAEADAMVAAGDVSSALEALAVIGTLDPDEPRTRALEASCYLVRAGDLERGGEFAAAALDYERALERAPDDEAARKGMERARAESDRLAARTLEIRKVFAAAMDAFAAEDLPAARRGFATVISKDPRDREAIRMLERTERAISQRAGRLVEQAQRFVANRLFDEADPLLVEAERLNPNAPSLARARTALRQARRSTEAARAAEAARARVTTKPGASPNTPQPQRSTLSERELADLYERGVASLRDNRSDDAVRYWELVWAAEPGYRQVATNLKREYLTRGMEAFASGRLEEAVARWKRVLEVDPNDSRARGYLERARKQMARSREILGEDQ